MPAPQDTIPCPEILEPTDVCIFHFSQIEFRKSRIETWILTKQPLLLRVTNQPWILNDGLNYDYIRDRIRRKQQHKGIPLAVATQEIFQKIGFIFNTQLSSDAVISHPKNAFANTSAFNGSESHNHEHAGLFASSIGTVVASQPPQERPLDKRETLCNSPPGVRTNGDDTLEKEIRQRNQYEPAQSSQQANAQTGKQTGRVPMRLEPGESATRTERQTPGCRFCWDVGSWTKEVLGRDHALDYNSYEAGAVGLLTVPQTSNGLNSEEESALLKLQKPGSDFQVLCNRYRAVRARLAIGFACIYEHNHRGHGLNRSGQTHPACKPPGQDFRYVSMRTTQAQQLCSGVDANQVGRFVRICHAGKMLPPENVSNNNRNVLVDTPALERFFPSRARKALYGQFHSWYDTKAAVPELTFAIGPEHLVYSTQPPNGLGAAGRETWKVSAISGRDGGQYAGQSHTRDRRACPGASRERLQPGMPQDGPWVVI